MLQLIRLPSSVGISILRRLTRTKKSVESPVSTSRSVLVTAGNYAQGTDREEERSEDCVLHQPAGSCVEQSEDYVLHQPTRSCVDQSEDCVLHKTTGSCVEQSKDCVLHQRINFLHAVYVLMTHM